MTYSIMAFMTRDLVPAALRAAPRPRRLRRRPPRAARAPPLSFSPTRLHTRAQHHWQGANAPTLSLSTGSSSALRHVYERSMMDVGGAPNQRLPDSPSADALAETEGQLLGSMMQAESAYNDAYHRLSTGGTMWGTLSILTPSRRTTEIFIYILLGSIAGWNARARCASCSPSSACNCSSS
jgi:hypothetical protein